MNTATSMYALGLAQIHNAIKLNGNKRTVLVQGHMGTGKSSLLKMLGNSLTSHTKCYFDCTTKDLGDITVPKMVEMQAGEDGTECVRFVPNEELGVHLGKPIILMIDEFGKANPAVKNAMMRVMLEGKVGAYTLHPDSLRFATTNLGAEGLGDLMLPHHRDRIIKVRVAKPTNVEWIENFAINNGIDHTMIAWVKDNPQLFQSFEEVKNPADNPYIFHDKEPRVAFVTPRSLHAASDILKVREHLDDTTLTAALMGTIGERGAMDLMAFVKISDQLPSLESIKKDPANAKIPESASALCMVVYRTLACIEREWVDAWVTYMNRIEPSAQGLFANGVRHSKYSRQAIVMQNAKFTEWAMKNNSLFTADKR
jgi:energy-coupling factor transporter ATP-binding protein EcfA2